ncbi:HNH endonuclease [Cupriavidus sp. 8B]
MGQLGKSAREVLEHDAILAFGGQRGGDLVHGFRVVREKQQVAAVYWSGNALGNDVEIAVCESRLSWEYSLAEVLGWLDIQKEKCSRSCNIHKFGSDWPIFGLKLNEVTEFLKGCMRLRRGFLANEDLLEIRKRSSSNELRATLASLRPSTHSAVIDLVARAKISTKCWYTKQDGTEAARPRSNPAYCYNWAFGEPGEPIAVCFWHASMAISEGHIVVEQNILALADRLEEVTEDEEEDPESRRRARSQGDRAKDLDAKLRRAWDDKQPIRVIVVDGQRRPAESLGRDSSTVALRFLDTNSWIVDSYEKETGKVRVRRLSSVESSIAVMSDVGFADSVLVDQKQVAEVVDLPADAPTLNGAIAPSRKYADQHSLLEGEAATREVTRSEYVRSRLVRDAVLRRAGGNCELCGVDGFLLPSGALFLETHHVIPLCEDGPDNEQNVVALCPNDHREAHYGERANELKKVLLERLALL